MDSQVPVDTAPELIRLYVLPQINTNDFHEVTPAQLDDYLSECKERTHAHRRNLYHQLAIIAKVDTNTTEAELDRLLQSDVRTLLIQTKCNKPQDIELIFLKINTAVDRFYMESIYRTPIGIAVEINGELLTSGRMRNDAKPFIEEGHVLVLTTNEDYKYCCFKEIVYVSNLWRYLEVMKTGDIVRIDDGQIVAKVVKCGSMRPLTVEVIRAGYLSSYMDVQIPYYIEGKELGEKDIVDIESAVKCGAHFLVIPGLKSAAYLQAVKEHIGDNVKLIGSINFEYLEMKFIDIADHILKLEAIWIDNLFCPASQRQLTGAIDQCKSFEKTLVGTVPLRTCSDFKKLENHDRIKQMDCLLIEKSPLRKKFPLIVKRLLPVSNRQIQVPSMENVACGVGIVNFVIRTIYTIPCQGIVVSNNCPRAALSFAIPQIYCPVIVVVHDDDTARLFNLRRNLKSVVLKDNVNALDFGIDFGRKNGIFTTGDFIISVSDSKNEKSEICVNLRAYYLPPNA